MGKESCVKEKVVEKPKGIEPPLFPDDEIERLKKEEKEKKEKDIKEIKGTETKNSFTLNFRNRWKKVKDTLEDGGISIFDDSDYNTNKQ
jgi:hypothetical protein